MLLAMSQGSSPPSRLERSFAFVDLCGFTDFSEEHGDDQAAELLHLLRRSVREASSSHGVRIDKWLGDGAMLVADEWAALVSTVIEVKWALADKSPLAMRAGLATGLVMVFEGDDYVGRAINLASKLCELAEPGQCLAPASLEIEKVPGVSACPAGTRRIPGFAGRLDLVSIDAAMDQASDERQPRGAAGQ
jgi:class 3 adenylate cyclase